MAGNENGLFCGVGVWPILRNVIELLIMLIRVKIHTFLHAGKVWNIANIFEQNVDKNPEKVQFISAENGHMTTRIDLEKLANQFSHWGSKSGLKQKNTVCLMVFNCPEYVAFWLGMAKIGVSTALLNTNIIGKPFMHSVQVSVEKSEKKIVVVDGELAETLRSEIQTLRSEGIEVIFLQELLQEISSLSDTRPSVSCRNQMKESDPVLFVFTSGTTGLPKAAKISNSRFYMMTLPCSEMAYLRDDERMYCALPLYHSAGGILGAGGCLLSGATLVFRFDISRLRPH
jgi:acyl-CoA synthetase (AMP-forming)/AMP-acid ligase II